MMYIQYCYTDNNEWKIVLNQEKESLPKHSLVEIFPEEKFDMATDGIFIV